MTAGLSRASRDCSAVRACRVPQRRALLERAPIVVLQVLVPELVFAHLCDKLSARVRSPIPGSIAPQPGPFVDSVGSLVAGPGSFAGFWGEK